jgi:hypothetical protein
MRKRRFSEEHIVRVLKEAEAGVPVAKLTQLEGISDVPSGASPRSRQPSRQEHKRSCGNPPVPHYDWTKYRGR